MHRLRCFPFAAMVVISSATFAFGGEIQGPGKNDPPPPPPPSATTFTSDGLTKPTAIEQPPIVLPDATTMLMEILLTIF